MIVMGCINDAHPEKLKKIWGGPTVKTKTDKPYSFSDIEKFFPKFFSFFRFNSSAISF